MPSEPLPLEDQLIPLLAGFTAQDLWSAQGAIIVSWGLLAFFPRWKWTPSLVLIAPLLHSVIYVSGLVSIMTSGDGGVDFSSFEFVVQMFKNPNAVFVGWTHYLVFDCLVGRMIVMDSVLCGASLVFHFLAIVPSLFLTLMFGPTGWLTYMLLRQAFLAPQKAGEDNMLKKTKIF